MITTLLTSPECAFGEVIKISGKLAVHDPEVLVDKVTHLILEFLPLTHLFINGNLNNRAEIDGSVEISLAGAHAGLTWAGHPG